MQVASGSFVWTLLSPNMDIRMTAWLNEWLTDWQLEWLTDWPNKWLTDWRACNNCGNNKYLGGERREMGRWSTFSFPGSLPSKIYAVQVHLLSGGGHGLGWDGMGWDPMGWRKCVPGDCPGQRQLQSVIKLSCSSCCCAAITVALLL